MGISSYIAFRGIAFIGIMTKKPMKSTFFVLTAMFACAGPLAAGTQLEIIANANAPTVDWARGPWVYSSGNFYGASQFGGASSMGSLFRCDPATGQYFLLHSFSGGNGGTSPSTGLFESPTNGSLYGTTYGGMHNAGTLYRIDKPGNFFETLHQFTAASGGNPDGIPMQASNGKLYGVVGTGGDNGFGGIYSINLDGSGYQLLRSFAGTGGGTRGKGLNCTGLVEGPGGILYGVTETGGSEDKGVFFAMSLNGLTYNVFREWPASGLRKPAQRLLLASDGAFYGAASEGGAGSSASPRREPSPNSTTSTNRPRDITPLGRSSKGMMDSSTVALSSPMAPSSAWQRTEAVSPCCTSSREGWITGSSRLLP